MRLNERTGDFAPTDKLFKRHYFRIAGDSSKIASAAFLSNLQLPLEQGE
jgi:hypothetical protein